MCERLDGKPRYVGHISIEGKKTSKSFKHSLEGLEQAKAWRAEKEKELFFKIKN